MHGAIWFVVVGLLFVVMALAGSVLKRLPLSTSMLYLAAGAALGPLGAGLLHVDVYGQSQLWERVTEVAVVVSLFAAGLKLRVPFSDGGWRLPLRLATVSMLITIGLVSLAGVYLMGLSPGAAILLGAILAPTDPVRASDVQVTDPADSDRLRFGLTGEAGLNDGTAFPFVMLGLGLLGLHELGDNGWRWIAIDLLWAVAAGLATGIVLGTLVGRVVLYLRKTHREAVGLDDFLGLGLIAFSYGAALFIHAYGFLAVFAAGLALRRIERKATGHDRPPPEVVSAGAGEDHATDPDSAPAYMAQAVLGFSEQLERMAEVAVVVLPRARGRGRGSRGVLGRRGVLRVARVDVGDRPRDRPHARAGCVGRGRPPAAAGRAGSPGRDGGHRCRRAGCRSRRCCRTRRRRRRCSTSPSRRPGC